METYFLYLILLPLVVLLGEAFFLFGWRLKKRPSIYVLVLRSLLRALLYAPAAAAGGHAGVVMPLPLAVFLVLLGGGIRLSPYLPILFIAFFSGSFFFQRFVRSLRALKAASNDSSFS